MKTIERTADVIFGETMEDLGGLKSFPVYMGCVNQPLSDDKYADMLWHISPNNGLLQLKTLIPLEILYPENHAGAVGNTWMNHHEAFADFISRFTPKSVLEIGGAHGILSKIYQHLSEETDWIIVEPNPVPVSGVKAKYIKKFFDDKFQLDQPVDTVVHSHVFEHIYDPQRFIQNISRFLDEGNNLIFSVPNMKEMLNRKYTNCINFEHTVFLTEPYIEYLLNQNGFKILECKYFLDDHSIFYACTRDKSVKPRDLPAGLYEENKRTYLDYVSYHVELVKHLNATINNMNENQKLYLFGAHVFAQYLIGFGLETSRIECLLDNDPNKQGKRLYGTRLYVKSPKILANIDKPVVILKAGVYNHEIRDDIVDNINPNTMFLD